MITVNTPSTAWVRMNSLGMDHSRFSDAYRAICRPRQLPQLA
jgi:hypothetical protein